MHTIHSSPARAWRRVRAAHFHWALPFVAAIAAWSIVAPASAQVAPAPLPVPPAAPVAARVAPPSIPMPAQTDPTSHPFHDAQILAAQLSAATPDYKIIYGVLDKWGLAKDNGWKNNPFLAQLSLDEAQFQAQIKAAGTSSKQDHPTAALLEGNVSSIAANGLADFIAQRVKQDAEITFILSFKKEVIDSGTGAVKVPHIDKLFPKTYSFIAAITPQQIAQGDFLGTFHADADADLNNLAGNLNDFFAAFSPGATLDDGGLLLRMASTAGVTLVNKKGTYKVIDAIEAEGDYYQSNLSPAAHQLDGAIKFLTVVSHMLTVNGSTWYSAADVKEVFDAKYGAPAIKNMVLALIGLSYVLDRSLYEGIGTDIAATVSGADSQWLVQLLATMDSTRQAALVTFLEDGVGAFDKIRVDESRLVSAAVSVAQLKQLTTDLQSLVDVIKDCPQIAPSVTADVTKVDLYFGELLTLEDLVVSAQGKQYVAAATDLTTLLGKWLAGDNDAKKLTTFMQSDGALIIDIAQAKDAASVTAALDTYALPAGSYIDKQMWAYTVTLNAYFGPAYGREKLVGSLSDTTSGRYGSRVGFTAPVGVAFNWALYPNAAPTEHHFLGDISVVGSVFDVGALASWRLGNGNSATTPPVTWANIVAPGIFLVFGIKDLPLSFMVGSEYGPGLRSVNGIAGTTTVQKAAWQLPMLAFVFDIPILNVHSYHGGSSAQ
jgi:hypothetical protein